MPEWRVGVKRPLRLTLVASRRSRSGLPDMFSMPGRGDGTPGDGEDGAPPRGRVLDSAAMAADGAEQTVVGREPVGGKDRGRMGAVFRGTVPRDDP